MDGPNRVGGPNDCFATLQKRNGGASDEPAHIRTPTTTLYVTSHAYLASLDAHSISLAPNALMLPPRAAAPCSAAGATEARRARARDLVTRIEALALARLAGGAGGGSALGKGRDQREQDHGEARRKVRRALPCRGGLFSDSVFGNPSNVIVPICNRTPARASIYRADP